MAAEKQFPLALVVKAIDQATAPLREINQRINQITAPVRKVNNSLKALSIEAGLPRLMQGFRGVGSAAARVADATWTLGKRIALMSVGAGYALYNVAKSAISTGNELGKMAERVGLSVDQYAQLQFAAGKADVSQEEFSMAVDQFNRRLGDMKAGTGPMLAFLNKVSPALAQQVKGAGSTKDALDLIIRAFEQVTDPAKRSALAVAMFGRSGAQMGVFLGQGSKKIMEAENTFFRLAGSQEAFAREASNLDNRVLPDLRAAFGGLQGALATELFPVLADLAKRLTRFVSEHQGELAGWARETAKAISDWVRRGELQKLGDNLASIAKAVARVVDAIGGLKGVAIVIGAIFGSQLIMSVAGLAGALWGLGAAAIPMLIRGVMVLGPVLASVGSSILGILAPIAPLLVALGALAAAAYLIYKNWRYFKLFWQFNVIDPINSVGEAMSAAWNKIKPIVDAIGGAIGSVARGIADPFGSQFATVSKVPSPTVSTGAQQVRDGSKPAISTSEAHVTVDFAGLPRGARVSTEDDSSVPLDLNLGYNLGMP